MADRIGISVTECLVGWAKSVGSEQVLGVGIPGEGCEGEDRQNSWINIAPSLPQPPTALIPFPSPNHYRQADKEESGSDLLLFCALCLTLRVGGWVGGGHLLVIWAA